MDIKFSDPVGTAGFFIFALSGVCLFSPDHPVQIAVFSRAPARIVDYF